MRLWRSTVFLRVVGGCALFVALALGLAWGVAYATVARIDREEARVLAEALETATEAFLAEGQEGLLSLAGMDPDDPLLDDDDIFYHLEEDETLFVLRGAEAEALAGYDGLWPGAEGDWAYLAHPEIDQPLTTLHTDLRGGQSLTLGRFVPDRRFEILWFLGLATQGMLIFGLPLALFIGLVTSASVFRRLDSLATTAETVAAGDLEARAPTTGAHDEFDRLAEGVNQMLDKLVALTRNVEAVTVGVAHDLKTPLAHIRGRLDLIQRDRADPEAVAAHVAQAEDRLDGLLRIFDALLRLGEIEAGKRRGAFAPVDLSTLAQDMGDSYAALFEDADKALHIAVLPGFTVQGDAELLVQLISNLLENALEHSRDGAQVHLSLVEIAGQVRLEIGDDGPGIAPAVQARVFERFYRAEASRSTPGNGLGLALVKAIATLHDAQIRLLADRPGAVFELVFPRYTK